MTVIAWDGKTLAADKMSSHGTLVRTVTKIFRIRGCLVGYTGDSTFGGQMLEWFRLGEVHPDFPIQQRDKDDWVGFLVIRPNGLIQTYERTPLPLTFEDTTFAMGCGRDFALAAMHCGKTAEEAVIITCLFDNSCGNGMNILRLEE